MFRRTNERFVLRRRLYFRRRHKIRDAFYHLSFSLLNHAKNIEGAPANSKSKRQGVVYGCGKGPLDRVDAPTPLSFPRRWRIIRERKGNCVVQKSTVATSTFRGKPQGNAREGERECVLHHHHSLTRLHVLSNVHGIQQSQRKRKTLRIENFKVQHFSLGRKFCKQDLFLA